MKILIEKAVIEQALEALKIYGEHAKDCPQWPTYTNPENYPKCDCGFEEALTALREALAEQAEQEPVAWRTFEGECGCYDYRGYENNEDYRDVFIKRNGEKYASWIEPLYAAPVRTKDLTDDEIEAIHKSFMARGVYAVVDEARAVIAADREKNK